MPMARGPGLNTKDESTIAAAKDLPLESNTSTTSPS